MSTMEKPNSGPESKAVTPEEMQNFLKEQMDEILSPDNKWYTGEEIGHEPTRSEAAKHYIDSGAAKDFRERWERRQAEKKPADSN